MGPVYYFSIPFPPGFITCQSCGSKTQLSHWNDGSSVSTQPRILHDTHNIVLLVSAVYVCENSHKLLAHDEVILKHFPTYRMVPWTCAHLFV